MHMTNQLPRKNLKESKITPQNYTNNLKYNYD